MLANDDGQIARPRASIQHFRESSFVNSSIMGAICCWLGNHKCMMIIMILVWTDHRQTTILIPDAPVLWQYTTLISP